MIRYIPDWAFKASCLISTILGLLINEKVCGLGASLPDKLQSDLCELWLSFRNASQQLGHLTGFSRESHSWHRCSQERSSSRVSTVCISCLFSQTHSPPPLPHLEIKLFKVWTELVLHSQLSSAGLSFWQRQKSCHWLSAVIYICCSGWVRPHLIQSTSASLIPKECCHWKAESGALMFQGSPLCECVRLRPHQLFMLCRPQPHSGTCSKAE